jgi:hypothetical protein
MRQRPWINNPAQEYHEMLATQERTITTVSSDPAVKAATAKLAEIRERHRLADARLAALQQRPPSQTDRSAAILSGTDLQNVLADRDAISREVRDLAGAVELAEQTLRKETVAAAGRVRNAAQSELEEHALPVIESVAGTFTSILAMGEFEQTMAERGASMIESYEGLLRIPHFGGSFTLPLPGQLRTVAQHVAEHYCAAFPKLRREINAAFADLLVE